MSAELAARLERLLWDYANEKLDPSIDPLDLGTLIFEAIEENRKSKPLG
jgi:hypothetical protein